MYLSIIYFLLLAFAFYEASTRKPLPTIFIFFVVIFFLLSFLRWERGTDWLSYYQLYETPYIYGDSAYEKSYVFLNLLFHSAFGLSYTHFLFFQAAIIYISLYVVIKKTCYLPCFALLCAFVLLGNGGIFFVRQTVAILIIFYSFLYIRKNNLVGFIVCILFASCFHISSVVALPIFFIYWFTFKVSFRNITIIFGILGVAIYLSSNGYFDFIIAKFTDYNELGLSTQTHTQFIMGLANKIVFLFIFLIFRVKNNKVDSGLRKIYLYNLFLYVFFGSINITLARVSNFINIFQVIQLSVIVYNQRKLINRMIVTVMLFLIFTVRTQFGDDQYRDLFVPYKSVFNKSLPVNVY